MDHFSKAAAKEVEYPGELKVGSRGAGVRRLQEWLCLRGERTTIDGSYQAATASAVSAFQDRAAIPRSAVIDQDTWTQLVAPMSGLIRLRASDVSTTTMSATILDVALRHLGMNPIEVGGQNCGPWVRAYMSGNEGAEWPWCAGFVTAIASQAAVIRNERAVLPRTYSCDSLAKDAQRLGRFIPGKQITEQALAKCHVFLVRLTPNDWTHTGFAHGPAGTVFQTIEGNTNDDGSREGYELVMRKRSTESKDFISLN